MRCVAAHTRPVEGHWSVRFGAQSLLVIGLVSGEASCSSTTAVSKTAASIATATTASTVPPRPTLPRGVTTTPPTTKPTGPSCVPSHLAWDFRGGGRGTGNDFGGIVARNTGSITCQLTGSVQVSALDTHLHPIELFRPLQTETVPAGVVLSTDAPRWLGSQQVPPGVFYADIYLIGAERDNPKTGQMCSATDEVTPANWQVSLLGTSWIVANHDPGDGPSDQPDVPSLYACLGAFNTAGISQVPS